MWDIDSIPELLIPTLESHLVAHSGPQVLQAEKIGSRILFAVGTSAIARLHPTTIPSTSEGGVGGQLTETDWKGYIRSLH